MNNSKKSAKSPKKARSPLFWILLIVALFMIGPYVGFLFAGAMSVILANPVVAIVAVLSLLLFFALLAIATKNKNKKSIILQLLTYSSWTLFSLAVISGSVMLAPYGFFDFLNTYQHDPIMYTGSLVLLALVVMSILFDFFYRKIEPKEKTGAPLYIRNTFAIILLLAALQQVFVFLIGIAYVVSGLLYKGEPLGYFALTTLYTFFYLVFIAMIIARIVSPNRFPFVRKYFLIFMGTSVGLLSAINLAGYLVP